jgi:DNA-binding transcriptional LysR family regulator
MSKAVNWESRIGRRLRLRDLHIFFAVADCGSMAKAGTRLHVTQPAISKAIGDLEAAVGVRLLDRSPQGVEPTVYGEALLKCGVAVFDELRQGIRRIEQLADPTAGEVRIGCQQAIAAAIIPPVIAELFELYPKIDFHITLLTNPTFEFPELHERSVDLMLTFLPGETAYNRLGDDVNVEILVDDRMYVVAGAQSRWVRRQNVDLAELIDEPWVLPPPGSWMSSFVAEAFKAKGLGMPRVKVATYSAGLLQNLWDTGKFIGVAGGFSLRLLGKRLGIKALPIDLPVWPFPVAIVMLKNRTVSPVVELFLKHVRAFMLSVGGKTT